MFQALDLELGYRYDDYDNSVLGKTSVHTPKVGLNWQVGWGLTLRGSWGKSFRTPKGEEISGSGVGIAGVNSLSGVVNIDSVLLNCTGTPVPGTLTAALNPTCSTDPDLVAPAGLIISGNPGPTGGVLSASGLVPPGTSVSLGPQRAKQLNLGFNFAPGPDDFNGFLTGLNIDVTWFKIDYTDLIGGTFAGSGANDPISSPFFISIPNPAAAITDPSNAAYWELLQNLAAIPTRTARAPGADDLPNVKFIQLDLTGNIGRAENEGIDFRARYDWEMGDWGSFHVGAEGYYEIKARTQTRLGSPWIDNVYEVDIETLQTTGNQLKKVRYRAGWTDGTWNFTTFLNYTGHSADDVFGNILLPDCYHAIGGGPGGCYPGSPWYGPYEADKFPLHSPANVLVDVTFGYNTGDMPANEYLRNIAIQVGVTNLLDKTPPLGVHPLRSRGTGVAAYDRNYSDLRREVSLTVTKTW
jgi:outer membrane receptor protein involved in Fe transport